MSLGDVGVDEPLSTSLSRFQISEVFHHKSDIDKDLDNDDDGLVLLKVSIIWSISTSHWQQALGDEDDGNGLVKSKVFRRKDHLEKHLQTHNPTKNVFSCDYCEKFFSRKDNLQAHVKSIHTQNIVFYNCTECNKKFRTKFNQKRHMLLIHKI